MTILSQPLTCSRPIVYQSHYCPEKFRPSLHYPRSHIITAQREEMKVDRRGPCRKVRTTTAQEKQIIQSGSGKSAAGASLCVSGPHARVGAGRSTLLLCVAVARRPKTSRGCKMREARNNEAPARRGGVGVYEYVGRRDCDALDLHQE
jgi:hypothetical protein